MAKRKVQILLKQVLDKKGWSVRYFAKRLNKDYPSMFRSIRTGDPKLSTLLEWAEALDVRIRDLYKDRTVAKKKRHT